jgi:hypothetical protein
VTNNALRFFEREGTSLPMGLSTVAFSASKRGWTTRRSVKVHRSITHLPNVVVPLDVDPLAWRDDSGRMAALF